MDISIPEAYSISDLKFCSWASVVTPWSPAPLTRAGPARGNGQGGAWVLSLPCSGFSPRPSGHRQSLLSLETGPALVSRQQQPGWSRPVVGGGGTRAVGTEGWTQGSPRPWGALRGVRTGWLGGFPEQ